MKSSKGIGASKLVRKRAPKDNTALHVKKVIGHGGGVADVFDPERHRGEWQNEQDPNRDKSQSQSQKQPKRGTHSVPTEIENAAIEDRLSGATEKEIQEKYGVADTYITAAIKRKFLNTDVGRKILQSVLLENAIASGEHTRMNIDKLAPMQAAVVTGIMTQRFVELQKHAKDNPLDTDLGQLAELGQSIRELRDMIGVGESESAIIEVESESVED